MSETKNSTTKKVLHTHDRIMHWSWLLADLLLAALLFGGMEALRLRLQNLDVAPQLLRMLPYLTTLFALMFTGKKLRAPAADGVPFDHPISMKKAGEQKQSPKQRTKKLLQKILQHASFDLTLHVRFEQREDLIRPAAVCRSIGMPAGAAGVGADAQSDEIGIVLEDLRNVSLVLASPVVEE